MNHRRRVLLGLAAVGFASSAQAAVAGDPVEALSPPDRALVAQAAHYLDGLTNAEGRFTQTDSAGRQASGDFWIQRPGRARFDYDPPSSLAVASDGHVVSQVNHQLKTTQSIPLSMTPLGIFLSRNIRFDGAVVVRKVTSTDKAFTLEVAERHGPSHGKIVLAFAKDPMALTGWALTDARGQTITVRLTRLARAAPRPKAFFDIYDPSLHGAHPGEATPLS